MRDRAISCRLAGRRTIAAGRRGGVGAAGPEVDGGEVVGLDPTDSDLLAAP